MFLNIFFRPVGLIIFTPYPYIIYNKTAASVQTPMQRLKKSSFLK